MLEKCHKWIIYQKNAADKVATADKINNCLLSEYLQSKIGFLFWISMSLDSPDFRMLKILIMYWGGSILFVHPVDQGEIKYDSHSRLKLWDKVDNLTEPLSCFCFLRILRFYRLAFLDKRKTFIFHTVSNKKTHLSDFETCVFHVYLRHYLS